MRQLNLLKNRRIGPRDDEIGPKITLSAILAPGDDAHRWDSSQAAEVVGYVYDVKPGGIETTNCRAREIGERDTHIELILNPSEAAAPRRVVVEITPRLRAAMSANGVDWSTPRLRAVYLGQWVKVRGWMMFDIEHIGQAENTAPGRPRNWRATAWELHPVTAISVTHAP